MKRIVIIGATSAIASACARLWAAEGAQFLLVARHAERLRQVAADLTARGAGAAHVLVMDAGDVAACARLADACAVLGGRVDIALLAHGTLPNAEDAQDVARAVASFSNNATATIAVMTALAGLFERQKHGTIAVISSVAGDRGRASNHLYGAAKAAVSVFAEGLRARLFGAGVHVVVIKPGFVDTPMTRGLGLPAALTATPAQVARIIVRAVAARRHTVHAPAWWGLIMLVIRHIPAAIMKRLRF